MILLGTSIIGGGRGEASGEFAHGVDASTGERLEPPYYAPSAAEVNRAAELAAAAFPSFSTTTGAERASFLRQIAANIEAQTDIILRRACAEAGLPEGRFRMEIARTCGQLLLFAGLIEEGSWLDARIDHADSNRTPFPKPDVRSMHRPLGPVAVFCASNFPLAFSVAGGDTASALAAGCPVVVKAHSSHPGTAEIVGAAVQAAVKSSGLHEGVFSLLYGGGRDVGQRLVQHPEVRAVGFTGSRAGGRALMDVAAARPEPIPVYAEMSSINPTFILPGALAERGAQLAAETHGSVTMGVGQFCTNPGLLIVDADATLAPFKAKLAELMESTAPAVMLNEVISTSYHKGIARLAGNGAVKQVAAANSSAEPNRSTPALFETSADAFLKDETLSEEVFGPATLLVVAAGAEDRLRIAQSLEGQLTATVHGTAEEIAAAKDLLAVLERKAGRVLCNSFSTGVEVCHAMVHGGPYPATSDGRSTSVGAQAIYRFTRPVCYQNFPDAALPRELQEGNPLQIRRLVDGKRE